MSNFLEYLDRVEIRTEVREIGCGRFNLERKISTVYVVEVFCKNVNRPYLGGWSCGYKQTLAVRLKRCIESGNAFESVTVKKDVNGATYLSADMKISMRTANADLKRLGF
jgi:hypothetical protein